MSIWTRLYEQTDCFHGRSAYANLPYEAIPATYLQISPPWLGGAGLGPAPSIGRGISTLEVGASSWEQGGFVILFAGAMYTGRYASFPCTPGRTVCNKLMFTGLNNRTLSALIVRRFRNELSPIALGDLGTPTLREQIEDVVFSMPGLYGWLDPVTRRRRAPIISWAMWPPFAPSRKYVLLNIPVRVEVPGWADYHARIFFYIYLYINSSGNLRSFIDRAEVWVEAGPASGRIADELLAGISTPAVIGDINSRFFGATRMLDAITFAKLYYLPGRAQSSGSAEDDVSLVLVKAG